ncbi:AAA family ATPase [Micrococcus luteus]|uniref:AAA family ATPase n=1 Tax=Micrococcus luteus TaxID=1270 RepID=UPI0010AEAA94|nr:AAA family ATPase [Micrococcus luteus]TKD54227.1 hypothetical protein FBF74_09300 [Micrococcus luteus]
MPPSSHATPDVAQRTADAAAWLREFFPHDDGGRVRLAEHTADGRDEYPRGVSLHDGPEPLADMAEALAEALVDGSEHADLYACPYAHEGGRYKGGAVARRHAHADVDGPLDLELVRDLGALAVASGSRTEGEPHGHVYVRLTRPVSADEHTALCAALGAYLGPHADASKVADNDLLRPAGTLNHKGGRRAPVAWLIRPDAPTVRTWEPAELAEHLGLAWPLPAAPSAPAGRAGTGEAASANPSARPRTGLEIRAELEALADAVRRAERGGGNTALNAAAYRLARLVCEAAPGADVPTEEEVHEALVGAYMDRPVPHGETASARRREAERTVRSGWSSGMSAPTPAPSRPSPSTAQSPADGSAARTAVSDGVRVVGEALADDEDDAEGEDAPARRFDFTDGGAFIFDLPDVVPAIWGRGNDVLWAEGEALMLYGGSGVGKTTIAGQLVRALILPGEGGHPSRVLGYPVEPATGRVLYLAMDRPSQVRRALNRQFAPDEREPVSQHLIVWQGPPQADMAEDTDLLRAMCADAGASHVVVDSLKDAAVGLSDDRVGAGWNRARQAALADGVQVLELHHQVKVRPDGPKGVDAVYGSTWLSAGAGSVIHLEGQPGDAVVKLRHLKQPASEVGPLEVIHDDRTGRSQVMDEADPLVLARAAGRVTVADLARAMFGTDAPTRNETEKARRRLDKLARTGALEVREVAGEGGGRPSKVYLPGAITRPRSNHESNHAP